MPAELLPDKAIPQLAIHIDSPAMLRVLRRLVQAGFIQNAEDIDRETAESLERLADLELADPGYDASTNGATNGKPFIWVSNHNGERVLKHLEAGPRFGSKITVHPRAHTALAALSEKEQQAVLTAAEALQPYPPESWPEKDVSRLSPDEPVYLLRVAPDLRVFLRILGSGDLELSDIMREETLRLFLERYRTGSRAG